MSIDRKSFLKSLFIGSISYKSVLKANSEQSNKIDIDNSDWKKIREQFNFKPGRIYMNNATMGLTPKSVIKAYKNAIDKSSFGYYSFAEKELLGNLAKFLKVNKTDISLTHNTTEGINIAAHGVKLKTGDEIIITDNEHVGAAVPWLNRAKKDGIKIVPIKIGDHAKQTLKNIKKACNKHTKVFALPHIPCTTGQILPIKEICNIAKKKKIITVIDGAHGVGMLNLNLTDMGCDIYVSSGHKWLLGPLGTGFIYSKKNIRVNMDVVFSGSYSFTEWHIEMPNTTKLGIANEGGHKFYYGSQSDALHSGFNQALLFQMEIGQQKIEDRVKELSLHLANQLLTLNNSITILTPLAENERGGIISFVANTMESIKLYNSLMSKNIRIRFVRESKLNCIRISTHIYNTKQEIDTLVNAIKEELNAK